MKLVANESELESDLESDLEPELEYLRVFCSLLESDSGVGNLFETLLAFDLFCGAGPGTLSIELEQQAELFSIARDFERVLPVFILLLNIKLRNF